MDGHQRPATEIAFGKAKEQSNFDRELHRRHRIIYIMVGEQDL